MKIFVGPPVEGINFFGREKEQRQLWRKLETNNLLMLAPRRIGKTSLIKRLRDTADKHDSKILYCSFAPCQDELACMKEIHKALDRDKTLQQNVTKNISSNLSKIKGFKIAGFGIDLKDVDKDQWTTIGEALTVALGKSSDDKQNLIIAANAEENDERLIYLLDVLENDGYLIENNQRYQFRLAWLREYWLKRVAP